MNRKYTVLLENNQAPLRWRCNRFGTGPWDGLGRRGGLGCGGAVSGAFGISELTVFKRL
jgi:hypothetical protein